MSLRRPAAALLAAVVAGTSPEGAFGEAYGQVPQQQQQQPTAPGPAWLPRGGAELQVLDKANARSQNLSVRTGGSAQYGSLTIEVRSCVVRPPDQPADAAAFLVIADSHPGAPGFRGWMLASAPSASMLEHPIYDVRVRGCSP